MTDPLTPAEALAFAAVITCDKRFPHLHAAADRLRQWGNEQHTTDSEMPSQDKEVDHAAW
jgi:hypothetical protein